MTLTDQAAAAALVKLLEDMRLQGRKSCIIEIIVCEGEAVEARPVKREKGILLQAK